MRVDFPTPGVPRPPTERSYLGTEPFVSPDPVTQLLVYVAELRTLDQRDGLSSERRSPVTIRKSDQRPRASHSRTSKKPEDRLSAFDDVGTRAEDRVDPGVGKFGIVVRGDHAADDNP